MIAILPGQSLSLRFRKGVDGKSSRFERGSSVSGVGPSIGVEVRLVVQWNISSVDRENVAVCS